MNDGTILIDPLTVIFALWSALLTVFLVGLSWLINRMFKMLDDLKLEDAKLNRMVTKEYTRRDDYLESQRQIIKYLQRIEDRMGKLREG